MTTTSAYSSLENSSLLSDYISSQTDTSSTSTTSSNASLYSDYETFLQILVTQIQNQDPTAPTDVSEFTSQLVQYAEVEQQINTNDKLDSILSTMNSNGITPLLSYVGAYVETASDGELVVQNGQSIIAYTLPEEALSTKVYVQNSSGDVIATLTASTDSGLNRLVWDGTCDDGTTADDGTYKFSITAKNNEGETMELEDIRVVGLVTGIETNDSGDIVLMASGLEINDEDIDAVWGAVGTASADTDETTETTG